MPAIKAAVGGRVWEKKAKGGREEGWFIPPPSGGTAALQGDKRKRLLFGFISTFSGGEGRGGGGPGDYLQKIRHLYFNIVLEALALEQVGVPTEQMVMVPK